MSLNRNSVNLRSWISDSISQNNSFGNRSVKDLYIPGTHDSTAYHIDFNILTNLYKGLSPMFQFLGIFPCIVEKFTKTQKATIYEQLCLGVRFLDFRISLYNNVYYCSHTYLCGHLDEFLDQIKKYHSENPREPIFLRYSVDYEHRQTISTY